MICFINFRPHPKLCIPVWIQLSTWLLGWPCPWKSFGDVVHGPPNSFRWEHSPVWTESCPGQDQPDHRAQTSGCRGSKPVAAVVVARSLQCWMHPQRHSIPRAQAVPWLRHTWELMKPMLRKELKQFHSKVINTSSQLPRFNHHGWCYMRFSHFACRSIRSMCLLLQGLGSWESIGELSILKRYQKWMKIILSRFTSK